MTALLFQLPLHLFLMMLLGFTLEQTLYTSIIGNGSDFILIITKVFDKEIAVAPVFLDFYPKFQVHFGI